MDLLTDHIAYDFISVFDQYTIAGKDYSITGFDGIPNSAEFDLTTIQIPYREIGFKCQTAE